MDQFCVQFFKPALDDGEDAMEVVGESTVLDRIDMKVRTKTECGKDEATKRTEVSRTSSASWMNASFVSRSLSGSRLS